MPRWFQRYNFLLSGDRTSSYMANLHILYIGTIDEWLDCADVTDTSTIMICREVLVNLRSLKLVCTDANLKNLYEKCKKVLTTAENTVTLESIKSDSLTNQRVRLIS